MANDYKVKDISLAQLGKTNLDLALTEMPVIADILNEAHAPVRKLEGAKIAVCIHHTIQTAALVQALVRLGAEVRCCSCNIFSTQDDAAAYTASTGVPVFAWKGETEEEYWECIENVLWETDPETGEKRWFPNQILDDGFDLTDYVITHYPEQAKLIKGASEETTTGVHRAKNHEKNNTLPFPVIDVNCAITKQKTDNTYGLMQSGIDGYIRALDYQIAGKNIVVVGYGQVGRGVAEGFRGLKGHVYVTEIDPICALQATLNGFKVVRLEDMIEYADVIVTTTGSVNVVDKQHFERLQNGAVLMNVGHFDDEINTKWLRENARWEELKPQVHRIRLFTQPSPDSEFVPSKKSFILLSEGRLANLGNAHGHASFIMSCSFTNQLAAQSCIKNEADDNWPHRVLEIARHIDEGTAMAHLIHLGGHLTTQTEEQAAYTGIPVNGPFKSEDYKY